MYSETMPRAAAGARSSATLICGLPRSGKTTLINYIRRNDVDRRCSMILNDCDSAAGLLARINARVSSAKSQHLLIELPPAQDPQPIAALFCNPECSGQAAQVRLDRM